LFSHTRLTACQNLLAGQLNPDVRAEKESQNMTSRQCAYTATGVTIQQDDEILLPSNAEIKGRLATLQNAFNQNKTEVSQQGQKVIEDTNKLLESAKLLIDTKNNGEFVQEVYSDALKMTYKETMADRRSNLKQIWKNFQASRNGTVAISKCIAQFIRLLVISRDFRLLINDLEMIMTNALQVREDSVATEPLSEFVMNPVTTTNLVGVHAVRGELGKNSSTYFYGATPKHDPTEAPFHAAPDSGSSGNEVDCVIPEPDDIEACLVYWLRMTNTLAENPDFRDSLNFLFKEIRTLSKYQPNQVNIDDIHEEASEHCHSVVAWMKAKKFLENWIATDYSLDRFLDSVRDFAEKSKTDPELAEFFEKLRTFFSVRVADKFYTQDEEGIREYACDTINSGRALFRGKYQDEFATLFREFQFINDGLQNDDVINQFQTNFHQLIRDAFMDENQKITIRQDLLNDLSNIVPSIVHSMSRLHLPNIDLCNERSDFHIRNGVLDCSDISPSNFYFTSKDIEEGEIMHNCVHVVISNLRARILGAEFTYHKKTFPRMDESGLLDLAIYGNNGMVISFEICSQGKNNTEIILQNNLCRINKFDIRLRNTKHDVLFAILSPLINAVVKKRVENIIQETIQKLASQVNQSHLLSHEQLE